MFRRFGTPSKLKVLKEVKAAKEEIKKAEVKPVEEVKTEPKEEVKEEVKVEKKATKSKKTSKKKDTIPEATL